MYFINMPDCFSFFREKFVDLEKEFEPSLLNSTVYVISMTLQISTFAINYRVRSIGYNCLLLCLCSYMCIWFVQNGIELTFLFFLHWSKLMEDDFSYSFKIVHLTHWVICVSFILFDTKLFIYELSVIFLFFQGHPFMESLLENKALLYSLLGSGSVVLALAVGIVPEFAQQFEIVDFPPEVRTANKGFQPKIKAIIYNKSNR